MKTNITINSFIKSKLLNYKKYIKGVKYITWLFFPKTATLFYNYKWSFYKKVVIVPHFGLGDLAVLVPALKEFETKFNTIYLVGNKDYIQAILVLFNFSNKIQILDVDINEKIYTSGFTKNEKLFFKSHGKVIYIGSLDNDPIIKYPNSFYIKIGVSSSIVNKQYNFNISINKFAFANKLIEILESQEEFIYVNINTSKGDLNAHENIEVNKIQRIYSYGKSAETLGINNYIDTSKSDIYSNVESILFNVALSLYATKTIISDAGLFNIIIKFKECKDLKVITRKHSHSHNNLLYKIQFNGKIQSRSIN